MEMADEAEGVVAVPGVQEPVEETQVVVTDVDGAEAAVERVADSDVDSPTPDSLQAPGETLTEFLTRNAEARVEHESMIAERARVAENAGAQRREAQLRREAGAESRVSAEHAEMLRASGFDPDELVELANGDVIKRSRLAYTLGKANAAHELLSNDIPNAILPSYTIPIDAREKALEAKERGDVVGYVRELAEGAVRATDATREAAFEGRVTKEVNKRLAAEIKARGLEAAPRRDAPPIAPMGSAGRGGPSPSEYANASRAQRAEWRRQGVEPVLTQ